MKAVPQRPGKPARLQGNATMTPIALTIPDAVKLSGLSRTSIYAALKRGDLTALKAGRRTLIPHAELDAFLAALPAYRPGS